MGSHPDVYEAFSSLAAEGLLSGFDVVPFMKHRMDGESDIQISNRIGQILDEGEHGLVVWMHTGSLAISEDALDSILARPQRPTMVYWEGDSHHPIYNPVQRAMVAIMRKCRHVYSPCGGPVIQSLRKAGIGSLAYAPSCASGSRFPRVWSPWDAHAYSIVMIGNRVTSRIPFKSWPGSVRRARLIERLATLHGAEMAVYGRGWSGPTAKGPCAFDSQSDVYKSSKITVGVNNSTLPYVFSNRLPIALASGIPVLYHRNPGLDQIFPHGMDDVFFDDENDVFGRVEALLDTDATHLETVSRRNREFFESNLSRVVVARYIVRRALGAPTRVSPSENTPLWQQIPPMIGR